MTIKQVISRVNTPERVVLNSNDDTNSNPFNDRFYAFKFAIDANKPITELTAKVYKANLNRVARALEITTAEQLISRQKDVINFMNAQNYTPQQRKIFLSSIFYMVNNATYTDIQRKMYIEAFQIAKNEQIGKLPVEDQKQQDVVDKAKGQAAVTAVKLQTNVNTELVNLKAAAKEAAAAAKVAKQKLAEAVALAKAK